MKWSDARAFILREFGNCYDGEKDDDPVFYCPECEEPLYKEDFPEFDELDADEGFICPICECELC